MGKLARVGGEARTAIGTEKREGTGLEREKGGGGGECGEEQNAATWTEDWGGERKDQHPGRVREKKEFCSFFGRMGWLANNTTVLCCDYNQAKTPNIRIINP